MLMAEHIKNNNPKSLVCPFCSIHCDDIVINTNNEKFSLPNTCNVNCSKRIESFNINKKNMRESQKHKTGFEGYIKKFSSVIINLVQNFSN